MEKGLIVIYDTDEKYVAALSHLLNNRTSFPFTAVGVSKEEDLKKLLSENNVDILLSVSNIPGQYKITNSCYNFVYLELSNDQKDKNCIYKYGSIKEITNETLERYNKEISSRKEWRLRDDLYIKVLNSFLSYKESLNKSPINDVIEHSYKTAILGEFVDLLFSNNDTIEIEYVKLLLNEKDPLAKLYDDWIMNNDLSIRDVIVESVNMSAERIETLNDLDFIIINEEINLGKSR